MDVVVRYRHAFVAVRVIFHVHVIDRVTGKRGQPAVIEALLKCFYGHTDLGEDGPAMIRSVDWPQYAVCEHNGFWVEPMFAHALYAGTDHNETGGNAGWAQISLGGRGGSWPERVSAAITGVSESSAAAAKLRRV